MLRSLPILLLLLSAPALSAESRGGPVAAACKRTSQACADGCAVDWGASMSHRKRLAHCMKNCERQADVCVERAVKGTGVKAPAPTPYREEKARSHYAKPERRAAPAGQGGRAPGGKEQLNVGAPDWLDESPKRRPSRAAEAPKSAPSKPEPVRQAATSKPLPSIPAAGKELPLEDAPLDELTAVELGVDDMHLDEPESRDDPLDAPSSGDTWTTPAARTTPRTTSDVERAEAEELMPLDDGQASGSAPAGPGSRSLPSGFLEPEVPAKAPSKPAATKQPAPAKSSPKASPFKKKKDISDWDPD